MNDLDYMRLALNLALKAKGKTSPNPLVGALVVKNNKIIASGYHRYCGGDHAEIIALKKAKQKARGARLYVTMEPCSHYGRTPPCVDQIIKSGVAEVVLGMVDPNPVNNGRSIEKLRKAGIKVKKGFLKEELKKANEPFIKYIATKMPFVVAKCAQTLDGKIATFSGQSKWITSQEARNYAHRLRNEFDAILAGINTVLKDNPYLNAAKKSKRIKKIILDSRLRIPLKVNLFKGVKPQDIFIATTGKAQKSKLRMLSGKGFHVIICPSRQGKVDLRYLFRGLAKREITSIFIEGGSETIGSALKARLVDKLLIFMAPKIIGDRKAKGSVSGFRISRVDKALRLKNLTFRKVSSKSDDMIIEAYV